MQPAYFELSLTDSHPDAGADSAPSSSQVPDEYSIDGLCARPSCDITIIPLNIICGVTRPLRPYRWTHGHVPPGM